MRFFESSPVKLLLLPLIPAAAIGIVTVAASIAPDSNTTCVYRDPAPQPQPPPPAPPKPCTGHCAVAPA